MGRASAYNFQHFRTHHLLEDAVGTIRRRGVQPGAVAPDFTLDDADGTSWRLADQRGRVVLLHFGSFT